MAVRVLMVDDSLLVRDVLRHHLECLGCQVVAEAENTLQALDLFRTVAPTLIILDVSVAHTGGIGALALFRIMRREQPGIPILVVSAVAYPELRESLLREGAFDYVLKPFDASSLAQVCNSLIKMFPELKLVRPPRANSSESKLEGSARPKPAHSELRRGVIR
jgi:CheY-like chemotaxis protein